MPQNKVLEQLQDNLQLVYRQAIDADNKLNGLQQEGHGKFQAVFADDQGFRTRSNRFLPYVKELAQELLEMKQEAELAPEDLQLMVKRLALLLKILQAFKSQA